MTGVQTCALPIFFATGEPFFQPFDIAIAPDGWIWTAQWGSLARRRGGFVRTRLADGYSEVVESDRSQGVAVTASGGVYLADCVSISLDCYPGYRYIRIYPSYSSRYLPSGAMAVVPMLATSVLRSTWGAIKTHYR